MSDHLEPEQSNDSAVKAQSSKPQRRKLPKSAIPRSLPPWKVLLHNDDKNTCEDVIKIICRLTPLDEQAAITCMLEAHKTGVAMLLVTHQERAELYVEQFASCGLTASAEPDQ
ncbi:MAG: ATP-dependent Clp protease adaptor ClpS [Phycisphaerae bacterium]|nr:ATP-dependent Clp protease adaptor ClpS [Phycisphaerae bacterium]